MPAFNRVMLDATMDPAGEVMATVQAPIADCRANRKAKPGPADRPGTYIPLAGRS